MLILSRDRAIQVREYLTAAELTRTVRDIPTEVRLSKTDGLPQDCVVNLDVINTIPKKALTGFISVLSAAKLEAVDHALKFALALE